MKKLFMILLCLCMLLPCALAEDTITYENGTLYMTRYQTEDGNTRIDHFDKTGALQDYEISYALPNAEGYRVNKRYLPDGSQDHEWWWSADHDLYHEIWFVDGKVDSYTYWYYNTDEAYEIYEEYDADGTLTKRHLYNENGERIDNKEPVEFAEKSYVDEDKNFIQEYYDDDHQAWCRYTRFKQPNEEGQVVVTLTNMETGMPITEIWYSDYMNSVRSRVYLYREDGLLAEARYYNEDGSTAAEVYDETGAVLYKDVTYAEPNAEGYEVTQRFLADGTLDHEWWWGEIDLYHEIWYVDSQVESYTYWWYNIDGHDIKYEEHCKQYSKYRYYDYDANGDRVMAESETVLH